MKVLFAVVAAIVSVAYLTQQVEAQVTPSDVEDVWPAIQACITHVCHVTPPAEFNIDWITARPCASTCTTQEFAKIIT